jgi:protein ImuB
MFSIMSRRVAAIVLPRLLCELATPLASTRQVQRPFGVVLLAPHQTNDEPLSERTLLDAVDESARRLGLREGLSVAEAHAFVATLEVRLVSQKQVHDALARVAEAALGFSPSVAIQAPEAVHLDVTGAAHLAGGELPLIEALRDQVEQLGHFARIAVAGGPRIAEAVARHGLDPLQVIEPGHDGHSLQALPVSALPIDDATACWLMRVGVVTIKDLSRLPRSQVAARLGNRASEVLMLASGHDPAPLHRYEPPSTLYEEASWDEGIEQQSALLFVLNRLTTRLATRLQGRGQALRAMLLTLEHDHAIARLRGVDETASTRIELPAPIDRAEDLLRTLRARLEQIELLAPVVGIRLEVPVIVRAPRIQLDLSRDVTASPDALPVLLAELAAEIGPDRIGTLALVDAHRPEARSSLLPASCAPSAATTPSVSFGADVTRLLPTPIPLGRTKLTPGRLLVIDRLPPLEVRSVRFDARLDDIEWWTSNPCSRDYFRLWLRGGKSGVAAWVYRDRVRGSAHLHGWLD